MGHRVWENLLIFFFFIILLNYKFLLTCLGDGREQFCGWNTVLELLLLLLLVGPVISGVRRSGVCLL